MIKVKHTFHNDTNESGNGIDLICVAKSASTILNVSARGTASSCTLTFYGKVCDSETYIPIKGCKSSDLIFSNTGTINESYVFDMSGFECYRVALSDVVGGNVTVTGEIINGVGV